MSLFESRRIRAALGVVALASLAACGGGGGGGSDGAQASPSSTTTTSVSGVASKGLLKNALVKAFAVNADGTQGAQIGDTLRTDASGHYTLPKLPQGAVVLIEVSVDDDTIMEDEATGADIKPAVGFKLRGAKVVEAGDNLQITPFSEMAVQLALANGGLKADVVDAANQKVVAFANFPVLSTEPTFDAKTHKPTNAAGVTLAAVSQMALNDDFATCKTHASVPDKVACVVSEMGARGVADGTLAARIEAAKAPYSAGVKEPVPPVAVQLPALAVGDVRDAITEAKTLIRNVRANGETAVTLPLAISLQTVADQFKGAVQPVDESAQLQLAAIAEAIQISIDPAGEMGSAFPAGGKSVVASLAKGRTLNCALYQDTDLNVPATQYAEVKVVTCGVNVASRWLGSSSSSDGTSSYQIETSISAVKVQPGAVAGQFVVNTVLGTQVTTNTYIYDYSTNTSASSSTTTPMIKVSLPMTATATLSPLPSGSLGGVTLSGFLAPSMNAWNMKHDRLKVDFKLASATTPTGLTRLNLSGSATAYAGTVPNVTVAVADGSYIQAATKVAQDAASGLTGDWTGASAHLELTAAAPQGAILKGSVDLTDFVDSVKREGPRAMVFTGSLTKSDGGLVFDGKISVDAPVDVSVAPNGYSTYPAGWTARIDGRLPLPNRPDLLLNLTVTQPVYGQYAFAGSYTQGADKILLSGLVDDKASEPNTVTLSTPSGVTVTAKYGDTVYQIKKGAAVVGVFTRSNGKIVYADNTYEQF